MNIHEVVAKYHAINSEAEARQFWQEHFSDMPFPGTEMDFRLGTLELLLALVLGDPTKPFYETKMVAFDDLPRWSRPHTIFRDIIIDRTAKVIPAVAVPGNVGDWAAYVGWPEHRHVFPHFRSVAILNQHLNDFDGVAKHGSKLSDREARQLFPEQPALAPYRR